MARLADEIERAQSVIEQTTRRLTGERAIPDRVISLADTDARPIRRGKPQRPTEFGYKVSIADTPEGFVVSHQVSIGAPADTDTLGAALDGAQATGTTHSRLAPRHVRRTVRSAEARCPRVPTLAA